MVHKQPQPEGSIVHDDKPISKLYAVVLACRKILHCHSIPLNQKYSRLRCLLRVKGFVIWFYLGWFGSILQFTQNIIKEGSKLRLLTCCSNITLSPPSYTGSAMQRELNFCNGQHSLLYFWLYLLSCLVVVIYFLLVTYEFWISMNILI